MKLLIRNAEKDDIDGIMSIEHESFHSNIIECMETFLERIMTFSDGFLVMEIDGEIAGYISSELWEYSEHINTDKFILGHSIAETHRNDGRELYVSSIGILEKYRGNRYGNVLFFELQERIRSKYPVQSAILIVSENWHAAKRIYEKNGFIQVSVITGFFDDDDNSDAIVMRKII